MQRSCSILITSGALITSCFVCYSFHEIGQPFDPSMVRGEISMAVLVFASVLHKGRRV
jgi:hypothetical protein